jgi:hypothetical protein
LRQNLAEHLPSELWLNRNAVGMGIASLLSDASHEMTTAALPGFMRANEFFELLAKVLC